MTTSAITHFVFVDFENVPEVDLGLVEGKPVHVTILIGKNQRKIDLPLVQQIRRLAAQVELVEVGGSGRNALDLTLAYYLGQAVLRAPDARFYIVSRDKDFDPMIAHLSAKHIKIVRRDRLSALPVQPEPRPGRAAKATVPVRPIAPARAEALVRTAEPEDRLERLITRLRANFSPRPKKKARLLARINSDFGNKLTEAEQDEKLDELIRRGVVSIDIKGGVTYIAEQ
jgi:hypothetical protein